MQLWNTLNKEELEAHLREVGHQFITISFYQYAQIENPHLFRDHLFLMWSKLEVVGRTYVAHEGINAQIAVPTHNLSQFREELYGIDFLNGKTQLRCGRFRSGIPLFEVENQSTR